MLTFDEFDKLLDELDGDSSETLKRKNRMYSGDSGDPLHNFRTGGQVDGSTMAQTAWHYWKKHFVALMDKIEKNDFSNREDTLEKIQDSINYLRFIWCISEEERKNYTSSVPEDIENSIDACTDKEEFHDCCDCKLNYVDSIGDGGFGPESYRGTPCYHCKNTYAFNSSEYKNAKYNFAPKD